MTRIDVPRSKGLMSAWHSRPTQAGSVKIPIVLLHEGFGLNSHIESIGERLVHRGHPVIAPNLFWRQSPDPAPYDDVPRALRFCANADVDEMVSDMAAAATIVSRGGAPVATLGFCIGGAASYIAAVRSSKVDRSIAYYPVSILNYWDRVGPPSAKLLAFFGTEDEFLGTKECAWLNALHDRPDLPMDVDVYPDAGHAFFNDARPDLYRSAPASDSWTRTLAFLDQI